jgi:hypothetical protein
VNLLAPSVAVPAAKILLVRSGRSESSGWAFVVEGPGVYARRLATANEIEEALDGESFQLVINDARDHPKEPFLFVEKFRERQAVSPLLLLCPMLEVDGVIRAIRHGVNDILSPPFDFTALHSRAAELMGGRLAGAAPKLPLARWFEIAGRLDDPEAAAESALPAPRRRKPPHSDGSALAAERNRLAAALQTERMARVVAEQERDRARAEAAASCVPVAPAPGRGSDLLNSEGNSAQSGAAAAELARREQALAAGREEHRVAALRLQHDRARLDAEQSAWALRIRGQVVAERAGPLGGADESAGREFAPSASARGAIKAEAEPPGHTDQSVSGYLSGLAQRAADFAALAGEVARTHAQLGEDRMAQAAAAADRMQQLEERAAALAQRESAAAERINAAEALLEAARRRGAQEQQEIQAGRVELEQLRLAHARDESELAERQKALTAQAETLAEREARWEENRALAEHADSLRRQQARDLAALDAQIQERSAELQRRQAEMEVAEAQIATTRAAVAEMQASAERARSEAEAELARLSREADALARTQQEQLTAAGELDRRTAGIAVAATALESDRATTAKWVDELRDQAAALRSEQAALAAESADLAERRRAFEEQRKQLCEHAARLLAD